MKLFFKPDVMGVKLCEVGEKIKVVSLAEKQVTDVGKGFELLGLSNSLWTRGFSAQSLHVLPMST